LAEVLGCSISSYSLDSLRYDLSKLRAKNPVERLPHSRRYRSPSSGYSVCLIFLKLFECIFAPLTAGLLRRVLEKKYSEGAAVWQRDCSLIR
jgi:hypothetical protein